METQKVEKNLHLGTLFMHGKARMQTLLVPKSPDAVKQLKMVRRWNVVLTHFQQIVLHDFLLMSQVAMKQRHKEWYY